MHPETDDQALRHVREHAVDDAFGNAADVDLDKAAPLRQSFNAKPA
jgi:hypothetical protein